MREWRCAWGEDKGKTARRSTRVAKAMQVRRRFAQMKREERMQREPGARNTAHHDSRCVAPWALIAPERSAASAGVDCG